jgi:cyclophilin family peptidyl-prolyl cis-trans isomerase
LAGLLPVALVLLGGCGGGGGGSTAAPANVAPTVAVALGAAAVAGATTQFVTTGTVDPDGSIASRSWAYGDGQTGTSDSHVYAAAGSYTATLTVTDNQGATASKSVSVSVAAAPVSNLVPTVAAAVSGESVAFVSTTFDTTGTADADGSIAAASWVFGDEKITPVVPTPAAPTLTTHTHTYAAPGTYTATYTVTDNQGGQASKAITVVVAKCSAAGTTVAQTSPYYAINATVCMQTSLGEVVLETYPSSLNGLQSAPITSANFLKYVDDGFFNGTIFHRVISGFVAQGGGYTTGPTAKTATYAPITLESNTGLLNWQYTLAMARTSAANSATSQFFINLVDNHFLDYASSTSPGYAVFGNVLPGASRTVVDAIGAVATATKSGLADVPVQDVVIRGMVRLP